MATTSIDLTRRRWLCVAGTAALGGTWPAIGAARDLALRAEVWSDPDCGCCAKWVKHLEEHRFVVTHQRVNDVSAVRKQLGMPEKYAGCHVARIDGYAVDGHVPAPDILRLLYERPKAIGLAVPDMPQGSPGMEQGGRKDPFQVLLVGSDARATVFKSYP